MQPVSNVGMVQTGGGPGAAPQPIQFKDVQPPDMGPGLPRVALPLSNQRGWAGLNQYDAYPDLLPNATPLAYNLNAIEHGGLLRTRLGLCKGGTSSQTTGVSICDLRLFIGGKAYVAKVSYDGSTNSTIETATVETDIKRAVRPKGIPSVTLSSPTAEEFRVVTATTGTTGGTERVRIAWSESGYPTSRFTDTSRNSDTVVSAAWTGVSSSTVNVPATGLTGSVLYVTVWVENRLGASPPFHGRVTVS